jgi:hypothetical protein
VVERVSWAVGADTERILTVEDARIAWGGLLTPTGAVTTRSGFRPAGNADPGRVFATSPTPNGTVHVEPFTYHLQSVRGGGVYTMTLDAVKDFDILTTAPPDATNARNDLIVAQQSDLFFGDQDSRMRVRHIVGNPAASPQDPQITGSPDFIRLARIVVQANATAIASADIQGLRPVDRTTVTLGGVLPVPDQAARNAIVNPYEGMTIYRRDRKSLEVFDGAAWRVVGTVAVANLADISDPVAGQLVMFGGTLYRFDGVVWLPVHVLSGRIMSGTGMQASITNNVETNLPKLALPAVKITAGRVYEFKVNLDAAITATATTFLVRVRRDVALTGPLLAEWSWQSGIANAEDARTFAQEWLAPTTAPAVPLFVSVLRTAGAGVMNVFGNRRSTFRVADAGAGVWAEVA